MGADFAFLFSAQFGSYCLTNKNCTIEHVYAFEPSKLCDSNWA